MIDIKTGKETSIHWLQVVDVYGFQLVAAFPDLLNETRLVITSMDGPSLTLCEEERAQGFEERGNYVIAPIGVKDSSIPDGGANEWYFFKGDLPEELITIKSFAAYLPFHFDHDERITELQREFWSQFKLLEPECYLLDTHVFLFATANEGLYKRVLQFVSSI